MAEVAVVEDDVQPGHIGLEAGQPRPAVCFIPAVDDGTVERRLVPGQRLEEVRALGDLVIDEQAVTLGPDLALPREYDRRGLVGREAAQERWLAEQIFERLPGDGEVEVRTVAGSVAVRVVDQNMHAPQGAAALQTLVGPLPGSPSESQHRVVGGQVIARGNDFREAELKVVKVNINAAPVRRQEFSTMGTQVVVGLPVIGFGDADCSERRDARDLLDEETAGLFARRLSAVIHTRDVVRQLDIGAAQSRQVLLIVDETGHLFCLSILPPALR